MAFGTNLSEAAKKTFVDTPIILYRYVKAGDGVKDRLGRAGQLIADTFVINEMGLSDDAGAAIAGGWTNWRLDQIEKARINCSMVRTTSSRFNVLFWKTSCSNNCRCSLFKRPKGGCSSKFRFDSNFKNGPGCCKKLQTKGSESSRIV